MQDASDSQRFTALYKAIGKMSSPGRVAASPFGFDVEEEDSASPPQVVAPPSVEAEVRVRPVVAEGLPVAWVTADTASAERRGERLARVRAERELVQERERIERRVSQMRQAQMESAVRESRSAVSVFEDRLRNGGHTGRLAWMEAQVVKVRGMVSGA